MGALTDMYDRELFKLSEKAHNAAFSVYSDAGEELIYEDNEILELGYFIFDSMIKTHDVVMRDSFASDFKLWFNRYRGQAPPESWFIFYSFVFGDDTDSIQNLKETAKRFGFVTFERISTDDDFFVFHPKEHSNGLEIVNVNHVTHAQRNRMFNQILNKNGQPIFLEWW